MKKCFISVVIAIIVAVAATLLVQHFFMTSSGSPAPAGKNSYYPVTSKLDEGGDFYMYLSTEKLIQGVDKFMQNIKSMALSEAAKNPAKKKEIEMGLNLAENVVNELGIMEISGIGMSSVTLDNGLNHDTTVVHHYKDKGKGLIWHAWGEKPHKLDSLKLLPADTVFANFGDSNLPYLWEWISKQAESSGIPQLAQGIKMVKPMLQSKGVDLDKILASHGTHGGFLMTQDDSNMVKLPIEKEIIEIPSPAIAIVHMVNDDTIFETIKKFAPVPVEEKDGIKRIVGPKLPLPIDVSPQLAMKGKLMIIASTGKLVDDILAAYEKGNGLIAGEEFKKLSKNMPDEGNSFSFLSSRIVKRISGILRTAMEKAPDMSKEQLEAFDKMNLLPKDLADYSITMNTPEGFVMKSNNNLGVGSALMLPVMATTGVIAAIAIPNLLTAMNKGKQKASMGDLKTISMALEAYMVDKGSYPMGNSLLEIKDKLEPFYIKTLPLKDGWKNDFFFTCKDGKNYFIATGGKDGKFAGWEQKGVYVVTSVHGFDNDIILSNGMFVFGPKVK